jgi:cryptochrome
MFREMFHTLAATTPKFEEMAGNRVCRQIEWDTDDAAMERWRKWEAAETGFPWIDALMMQLRTEGFVHHLGRHSLACFLTRGDLWVSWERGAETFEK